MKGGFRYAHSGGVDWQECVARCASALGKPGGGLGFVYFTEPLLPHAGDIVDTLRELTGVRDWVGTVGIGVVATGTEYLDEPALALMVADLPAESYRVFSGKRRAPPPGERTPAGAVAAHFGVVHGDPQTPDMSDLIADMAARVDSGYLVGGKLFPSAGVDEDDLRRVLEPFFGSENLVVEVCELPDAGSKDYASIVLARAHKSPSKARLE